MELKQINEHLIDAFKAIDSGNRIQARFKLNGASALLRPHRNDYADVYVAYSNIQAAINCLKKEGITRASKGYLLAQVDKVILECEQWIERRVA